MDPYAGQNLSNTFFFLGSALTLCTAFAVYYLNFVSHNPQQHEKQALKKIQELTILGMIIVLVAKFSSFYFDNQVQTLKPYHQPIRTVTATVKILITSNELHDSTHFFQQGGYLVFGKGTQLLLATSATDSYGNPQGINRVQFSGTFTMDPTNPVASQLVTDLSKTEYIQIAFAPMTHQAHVIQGQAIVIINDEVQLEIPIPEQDTPDGIIYVRDLKQVFRDFK